MSPMLLEAFNLLLAVQAAQATVAGTVRNEETGEPLAGAIVTLSDVGRSTSTDPAGRYLLPEVPAGPQHVAVRFIGHSPHALHALVPATGRLEINVALRPAPLRLRTIQVRSPPSIRGLDGSDSTSFSDRRSSIAAVRNHPLLAEPDAFQVLGGGDVVLRPEAPSGVHVRGGASDQTGYLLDGIPVLSPYHAAGLFSAWNPDALSEVSLSASMPPLEHPDALSGTIAGNTRVPGPHLAAQGSFSTTQARVTLDGPIGGTGAGVLVSLRSAFPGVPLPERDRSYLRVESGDRLVKVEAPLLGGRLRLLGYDSENEIDAAAEADGLGPEAPRNVFEWHSGSVGVEWKRAFSGLALGLTGWSAEADAGSRWGAPPVRIGLASSRHDLGLQATAERRSGGVATAAGLRIERSRTSYRIGFDSPDAGTHSLAATTPIATAFGRHTRPLGRRSDLTLGASVAMAGGGVHLGPRAQLRWRPSRRLTLSASYARVHQFAQSLRNPESVVGTVFPADLFIGAGAPGVPAARSDGGAIAAEYVPSGGVRLGAQVYRRVSRGLLLVAPRDGGPFTSGPFAVGSGSASGVSLDGAVSNARFGVVASYGIQRVRLAYAESGYVPDHGTTHLLEGGVIVFPTATVSVRVGATAALGRRTTAAAGGLEWEACNLLDQGCEFTGSPNHDGQPLGSTALPAYLRVDLGVRKHWHFHLAGRDATVALFGTITNLLNRKNILTYLRAPDAGEPHPIEMRPLAPLLIGLDWQL
ncbi:MAG: TonB-dependent receptor [Gemmatimonadales bacterium]|nr:TonB-dependent receptor [Gemmatimonadales bacterium]